MKARMHLRFAGLAWLTLTGVATGMADQPRPLRSATSENGLFRLQIRAGRPGGDALRGCKATLYALAEPRQRGRPLWSRFLVNEVAPERVFIRNDGRCVVTLGEFERGGARHAMVIYGPDGRLLRHFRLTDLLEAEDWRHVRQEGQALDWLAGAHGKFIQDPPAFELTLGHGRTIRIDLRTLEPAGKAGQARWVAVPSEWRALLIEPELEPAAEIKSDKLAGRAGAATPPNEKAPSETPPETTKTPSAAGHVASENEQLSEEKPTPKNRPDMASLTEPAEPGAAEDRPTPGDAFPGAIPLPDPARPFDYLAWANARIRSTGLTAVSDFRAAMEHHVPWPGSVEVLRSAAGGESTALADTALRAWIAQNREALAYFRSASELPYDGWPLESEDGSLLGALLPHLAPLRELGRAAVIEGRLAAQAGDLQEAADVYLDVLAVGGQVAGGATVIERLVGQAIQAPATDGLLDLFAQAGADRLDYAALAERLDRTARSQRTLSQAIRTERAMFLDTIQRLYRYNPQNRTCTLDLDRAREFLNLVSGHDEHEAAQVERLLKQQEDAGFEQVVAEGEAFYDALEEALRLPYPRAKARLAALTAEAVDQGRLSPLTRVMVPDLGRVLFLETRAEARRRAVRLVARLQAHRQAHGRYPGTLAELDAGDAAVDPFTGDTFRYRRQGNGFSLYSLGDDGVDDGGRHEVRGAEGDLVFWPRPEPR